MRVVEAPDVVDGREEGGGGDGADAGTERRRGARGSWPARCSILSSQYASCPLRGRMRANSGATTERKRPGGAGGGRGEQSAPHCPDGTR